jgi:beta-lactam-binding protein with PASTA domain
VICKTITRAENTLQDAGLNSEVDVVASPNPDCPTAGHVGAQDPVPGELVDPGSTVTLQPSGP